MRNGLVRTLVVSLIVVLLLTQKHSGFMLAFVLLFLVPWFAYSGYRCLRFPIERKLRIQKTIVWFVAVVVIVSVHLVMYRSAKSYALGAYSHAWRSLNNIHADHVITSMPITQ